VFESLGSSKNLDFGDISGLSSFERSEDNIIQPEIVEYRQQQQMLLERKNRYQHIICTVVQDKVTSKYQAFIRGEAITVLNNCTDFWNG
jgi:hypothetical protein